MIILRGDNDDPSFNVDFSSPLKLDSSQFKKFVEYFENSFQTVEIVEAKSFRDQRIGDKFFTREWSSDEDAILFDVNISTEEMARKLGRSWMSVDIRRGGLMPRILEYAHKKNVDIYKVDIKKLIEEYRVEYEKTKTKNREERVKERKERKRGREEYLSLKEDIPKYEALIDSPISQISKEELEKKKNRFRELEEELKISEDGE